MPLSDNSMRLYEVNRMTKEDIIRILDIAIEQSRAEACNGCVFADTEEWEEDEEIEKFFAEARGVGEQHD